MNKEEIKPLSFKCINMLSLVMGDTLNKYKLNSSCLHLYMIYILFGNVFVQVLSNKQGHNSFRPTFFLSFPLSYLCVLQSRLSSLNIRAGPGLHRYKMGSCPSVHESINGAHTDLPTLQHDSQGLEKGLRLFSLFTKEVTLS